MRARRSSPRSEAIAQQRDLAAVPVAHDIAGVAVVVVPVVLAVLAQARLGARQLVIEFDADLAKHALEVLFQGLKPAEEVHANIAVEAVDLVIVQPRPLVIFEELREGRRRLPAAIAEMIGRNLAVPRVAVEGKLEIAPPDFVVVEKCARFLRRHVVVEAVVLRHGLEPAALEQRPRALPPAMLSPITRLAS